MRSIARVPEDVAARIRPAVEALLSPEQLTDLFAGVEFRQLEPYAAPEPSLGAAVRLANGRVAALAYGKGSHLLRVDLPEDASVSAFLREVALPEDAIVWKRGEPRREAALATAEEGASHVMMAASLEVRQQEVRQHLRAALARLSSRQRDLLLARANGHSHEEIRAHFGYANISTVKTKIAEARRRFLAAAVEVGLSPGSARQNHRRASAKELDDDQPRHGSATVLEEPLPPTPLNFRLTPVAFEVLARGLETRRSETTRR